MFEKCTLDVNPTLSTAYAWRTLFKLWLAPKEKAAYTGVSHKIYTVFDSLSYRQLQSFFNDFFTELKIMSYIFHGVYHRVTG